MTLCVCDFPLDKLGFRMMVAAYLTKQKRTVKKLKNNIPGDDWAPGFMKRNGLTNWIAMSIRRKRASINKEQLKQYFDNIQNELKDITPCNIWNYDVANLRENPGTRKYAMKWGKKYAERIMDSSKATFSVIFAEMLKVKLYTICCL